MSRHSATQRRIPRRSQSHCQEPKRYCGAPEAALSGLPSAGSTLPRRSRSPLDRLEKRRSSRGLRAEVTGEVSRSSGLRDADHAPRDPLVRAAGARTASSVAYDGARSSRCPACVTDDALTAIERLRGSRARSRFCAELAPGRMDVSARSRSRFRGSRRQRRIGLAAGQDPGCATVGVRQRCRRPAAAVELILDRRPRTASTSNCSAIGRHLPPTRATDRAPREHGRQSAGPDEDQRPTISRPRVPHSGRARAVRA